SFVHVKAEKRRIVAVRVRAAVDLAEGVDAYGGVPICHCVQCWTGGVLAAGIHPPSTCEVARKVTCSRASGYSVTGRSGGQACPHDRRSTRVSPHIERVVGSAADDQRGSDSIGN